VTTSTITLNMSTAGLNGASLTRLTSGFSTSKGIREHVCEILDGGKDAFQRREHLYSTVKEQS
jgi:hypothetical protein